MKIQDIQPQDIEHAFWEAMKCGWGSGKVEKQSIPGLPRYKSVPFKSGKFYVLDTYCTTPLNDCSAGFTTIWFDNTPVWTMHYAGRYPKEVIPFLKLALQDNIRSERFIGGRGPVYFEHTDHPNLVYTNLCAPGKRGFTDFSGTEVICEHDYPLGYHTYYGLSLI